MVIMQSPQASVLSSEPHGSGLTIGPNAWLKRKVRGGHYWSSAWSRLLTLEIKHVFGRELRGKSVWIRVAPPGQSLSRSGEDH